MRDITNEFVRVREQGDANQYFLETAAGRWMLGLIHNGEMLVDEQRRRLTHIAALWNAEAQRRVSSNGDDGPAGPSYEPREKPVQRKGRQVLQNAMTLRDHFTYCERTMGDSHGCTCGMDAYAKLLREADAACDFCNGFRVVNNNLPGGPDLPCPACSTLTKEGGL